MRLERSLTDEERAFEGLDLAFGRQLAGVLILLGRVMRNAGTTAASLGTHTLEGTRDWISNPYAYAQAAKAAEVVLAALCPPGEQTPPRISGGPDDLGIGQVIGNLGQGYAAAALTAVTGHVFTAELEEWAARIRTRLGSEVVQRLAPYAMPHPPTAPATTPSKPRRS